ncbi:hypothetical protein CVV68_01300 [Arthrobacter livingstonensis]|uniref:DUF6286 domain-containing protein n=1 Tax=Arthrobacter livingstonensis TaxID=670078 RepID=A0A2V5LHT9_9MICC|nr:hypothetical protein CVV68_01300 [Arthrobacter livingstonensis]
MAILLLAAGVALTWLAVARLLDGTWSTILQQPRNWLAGLRWDSPDLWGLGVAAVVLGVVLLLCALIPGAFTALTVRNAAREDTGVGQDGVGQDNEPGMYKRETVMTRRAVAHLARAQCVQIDGVSAASATASNKRVHLKVTTSLRETEDLRARVTDAVRERLDTTGLDPVPRVTATMETTG